MESAVADGDQNRRSPSRANVRYEGRRYMSKSQRACDLCRSRKSACRTDRVGLPCRLCSSLGRPCTFDSGPLHRPARSSKRPDHQQATGAGSAESAASESILHPHAMDLDGSLVVPPVVSLESNSEMGFGRLEDWTPSADQLFADPLLFSRDMLMPAGFEHDMTALSGGSSMANLISEPYADFQISPSISIRDSSSESEVILPESCSLDSIAENVSMQIMGPTGDQDPHLVRYQRYNSQNTFTYNRISYRTVVDRNSYDQFEFTRSDHSSIKTNQCLHSVALLEEKDKLQNLIPLDIGERLILL
jgi:hypothetical protein